MMPFPTGVRVWVAAGHTDMRRGMRGLALQVQEALKRDPSNVSGEIMWRSRPPDAARAG
jgi:transposase